MTMYREHRLTDARTLTADFLARGFERRGTFLALRLFPEQVIRT
jgi:hypothetical protein